MIRPSPLPFVVLLSASTLASCRRSETGAAPDASTPTATAPVAAAAAGTCPAGKWKYDYTDQFLESLARNSAGARVVSERGEYVCTVTGNERGSYTCVASEGGVENVFEAPMGGMTMKVTVKMNGSSSADFEPAGPGKWKTTRVDMSAFRMETKASLAGREMPMPAANAFPGMDRPGTILEYRCEGDVLKLKPIVDAMAIDFVTLKRVP
jgi:hypothetical protein